MGTRIRFLATLPLAAALAWPTPTVGAAGGDPQPASAHGAHVRAASRTTVPCYRGRYSLLVPPGWQGGTGDCARHNGYWTEGHTASLEVTIGPMDVAAGRPLARWLARRVVGAGRARGPVRLDERDLGGVVEETAAVELAMPGGVTREVHALAAVAHRRLYYFAGTVFDADSPTGLSDILTIDAVLTSISFATPSIRVVGR